MDVINKISVLLKDKHLKQKDLTDHLGLSKNIFSEWKSGRATSYMKYLPQIAEFFGITVDQLISEGKPKEAPQFTMNDIMPTVLIPVFESISAGCGAYADSNIVDYYPIPLRNPDYKDEYYCVKVKGNSMSPVIENQDLIVVHRQDFADDGQIAAVVVGDEGFVKRIFFGKNKIVLRSYNSDYEDRIYENSELDEVHICGVVKQIVRSII